MSVVVEQIETLRQKLLDLSTRNRLLSFSHTRTNALQFADELPDQLFGELLAGRALVFEPVPEPSEAELRRYWAAQGREETSQRPDAKRWAEHLGIDTDLELPLGSDVTDRPGRHRDDRIQTLLYPDQLESRVRRLRSEARSALEESGTNLLFVAFGFLEWRDPKEQARGHLAPLILVPVGIERSRTRGGAPRYELSWTGEDLQTNLSLERMLGVRFDLDLPGFGADEDGRYPSPEDYMREVRSLCRDRDGWQVRRFATLSLFNFASLLVYLDLDPARWPEGAPLAERPLLRRLLGAEPRIEPTPLEEKEARATRIDLELPLVDRADSSQAEALLRALAGETMLVEGPPGTGKSQTITNLIAALLEQGKTVLFVSEKLAALEVVRRRLDALGLGEFCLELHSHKTRKRALLDDLERSLKKRQRGATRSGLQERLGRLRRQRDELSAYGSVLLQPYGSLGEPLWRLLVRAGRLRTEAAGAGLGATPPWPGDPKEVTPADRLDALARIREIEQAILTLGHPIPRRHPWAGISSATVLPMDAPVVIEALTAWRDAAAAAQARLACLHERFGIGLAGDADITSMLQRLRAVRTLRGPLRDGEALLRELASLLGRPFSPSLESLQAATAIVELAAEVPLSDLHLRSEALLDESVAPILDQLERDIDALKTARRRVPRGFLEIAWSSDPDELRETASILEGAGMLARLRAPFRRARATYLSLTRLQDAPPASDMADQLETLADAIEAKRRLGASDAAGASLGAGFAGADTDIAALRRLHRWMRDCQGRMRGGGGPLPGRAIALLPANQLRELAGRRDNALSQAAEALRALSAAAPAAGGLQESLLAGLAYRLLPPDLARRVIAEGGDEAMEALESGLESLSRERETAARAEAVFVERTGLDRDLWTQASEETDPDTSVLERADRALVAPEAIRDWLRYDQIRAGSIPPGLASLLARAEAGDLAPAHLHLGYELALHDGLARRAFGEIVTLRGAAGARLESIARDFRELDEEIMELRRADLAQRLRSRPMPAGRMGARAGDFSDEALIKREIGKATRHVPIRQLVERAGGALQALKPCFMMGPLSIAQYLPPGGQRFDVVIMDEASQLEPEDAIGALARADQAIIVGDTKQLPPTSFFDRVVLSDEDDDETAVAGTAQSIMEVAAPRIAAPARLRWHYRSRHASLIAFSNSEFYDDELIVFPTARHSDPRFGVGFEYIVGAVAKGGINDLEAGRVVDRILDWLANDLGRSMGVAAMNIKQAEHIEAVLAERLSEQPELQARLEQASHGVEPFFIKNLENVQGDERDVILISMTYGPEIPGGRVPQRFGPINRDSGWRRLNVLVTRAKERMEIFSSMRADDILLGERPSRGIEVLRRFLAFAETGKLRPRESITGRPADSEFEVAVKKALACAGYDCEPQLGVAGFFIDLAVRDPDDPGSFLLAVECDGATYHWSLVARDRDRLRQEILENHGWEVLRIWSTDWFRDPDAEIRRVLDRLEKLRERPEPPPASSAEPPSPPMPPSGPVDDTEASEQAGLDFERIVASPVATIEDARAQLVALRENEIEVDFPSTDPARGLLRRQMLDMLLRFRPTDVDAFHRLIPKEMREKTDGEQFARYAGRVFEILEAVSREPAELP